MHAISGYRGNRPTPPARPPQTNTQTDRIDYNTLPLASTQCKYAASCCEATQADLLTQHKMRMTNDYDCCSGWS